MNIISNLAGENFTTVRLGNGTATDQLWEVPTNPTSEIFSWAPSNLTIAEYEAQVGVDTMPNIYLLSMLSNMSYALVGAVLNQQ